MFISDIEEKIMETLGLKIQTLIDFAKIWLLRNEEWTRILCTFEAMK